MERFAFAVNVGLPVALLVLAYFTGTAVERTHYRAIRIRESRSRRMPVTNLRRPPAHWQVEDAALVSGSVVVSLDHFKRFLAGLRSLVGGRVRAYESLLDRARREALLRMKEEAHGRGLHAVIDVRLETARIASARRGGQGTTGVEILAYGTGLKLRDAP